MQCPSCGAFISEKDVFCGECGRPLDEVSAEPLSPTEAKDLPTLDLDSLTEPPPSPTAPKIQPTAVCLLAMVVVLALCVCGVVFFVLVGGPEDPTPTPTAVAKLIPTEIARPTEIAATTGELIFEDDFDDLSEWDVFSEDNTLAEYVDGEYRIAVHQANFMAWSNPISDQEYDDFVMEVDARPVEGPQDNNFGLVIRDQGDEENFYWYQVSGDGYYSVDMMWLGEWVTLVNWQQSEAINQGLGATNRLKVICSGNQCSFYANDTWLTNVTDDTFTSGQIGLAAGAFNVEGVVVHFDNVKVYALDDEPASKE